MVLFLVGCGWLERPSLTPVVQHVGEVALRVEPGSRVRTAGPEKISVDVADGRRWFDLTWSTDKPEILAANWAGQNCEPVMWDELVIGDGYWARGGLCTVQDRWHWAIVLARPAGDRTLFITYVADEHFVQYEHAWVDAMHTAFSVGLGEPQETLPADEIRRRVRQGMAQGVGRLPVPGGGILSSRMHDQLRDVYDKLAVPSPSPLPVVDLRVPVQGP